MLLCVTAAVLGGQVTQRIPRQTSPAAGVILGILRNPIGLGLGGVSIEVQNLDSSQVFRTVTTGDGAFRFVNLLPGRYRLDAHLDGFENVARGELRLNAGDIFTLEATLVPMAKESSGRPEPMPGPSYRSLPDAATAEVPEEARSTEPLPSAERVFTPVPDRWKYDWPEYRRYGFPGEFPYEKGHLLDPFNRNKLKGDEPIFGQTFLNLNFTSDTFADPRRVPTSSNISSSQAGNFGFFGGFGQFAMNENLAFSATLFHGDTSFKPVDWQIKFTPEVNINYLTVQETGVVNVDVRQGTSRVDSHVGLQEAFVEVKLADLSHAYDFVSARAGIQTFNSDFRGFIFFDQEPGLRIFGTLDSNRYQYNLAYFAMLEKDTNSG